MRTVNQREVLRRQKARMEVNQTKVKKISPKKAIKEIGMKCGNCQEVIGETYNLEVAKQHMLICQLIPKMASGTAGTRVLSLVSFPTIETTVFRNDCF